MKTHRLAQSLQVFFEIVTIKILNFKKKDNISNLDLKCQFLVAAILFKNSMPVYPEVLKKIVNIAV